MKLYVVGLGPSAGRDMTLYAKEILDQAECIVGYKNYVNLIEVDYLNKELIKSDADKSVERCHVAIQKAIEGVVTALVCAGDSGVFGMASLVYHVAKEYPTVEIEVIPGVTSAIGGGALLGTPIGDDFCVLSLCDQINTWEVIERRLMAAVEGGFVICLYDNTPEMVRKACRILLWKRAPEIVCGYVKNAGHWGQKMEILSLEDLFSRSTEIDEFTTIYIGNTQTEVVNGKMHTPRGSSDVERMPVNPY